MYKVTRNGVVYKTTPHREAAINAFLDEYTHSVSFAKSAKSSLEGCIGDPEWLGWKNLNGDLLHIAVVHSDKYTWD